MKRLLVAIGVVGADVGCKRHCSPKAVVADNVGAPRQGPPPA